MHIAKVMKDEDPNHQICSAKPFRDQGCGRLHLYIPPAAPAIKGGYPNKQNIVALGALETIGWEGICLLPRASL